MSYRSSMGESPIRAAVAGDAPAVPTGSPVDWAMATALRLWQESECRDRMTTEGVAEGLRDSDGPPPGSETTIQDEIDGVVARWRAAHRGEARSRNVHTTEPAMTAIPMAHARAEVVAR